MRKTWLENLRWQRSHGSGATQEVKWRTSITCRARLRPRRMKREEPEAAFPSRPVLLPVVNDPCW